MLTSSLDDEFGLAELQVFYRMQLLHQLVQLIHSDSTLQS